ncbi:hypothetical protein [Calothrix sp. PCC 6303]|uniref:hypothetical protein n=1 Tax=Calothrix sp. PCC 6303 TaxID=1170562 RepID=UPI00118183D4|nr:hypothetical protein [Calothrix sp. PCC 6303]
MSSLVGWRNGVACYFQKPLRVYPQGSNPTTFNINELMRLPRPTTLAFSSRRYANGNPFWERERLRRTLRKRYRAR